ncbi:ABC transporter ATP-binding protein [Fibrobacterota bacterium]
MTETVISIQGIGKRYRIGLEEEKHDTFFGKLVAQISAPVRNLKKLKSLTSFKKTADGESEDIIWALKNVSFDIFQGEIVGLIGLNGAGKSTLLKILSKITVPTNGKATIKGRIGSLLEVGTGFHPELTGRENVYLNGTILGMSKKEIDRKFEEIVEFSEVGKFIDTPVKRYSSGMRVRLGFSVAAHLDPEILLIDEVLAVGDVAFQQKCLGKMGDVATEGRTVVFVSHNMEMIQRLCPRTILLENGEKKGDGDTNDIISMYFNQPFLKVKKSDSLYDAPRKKQYGKLIRFTSCMILNAQGENENALRLGEPFTIVMEAVALKDMLHVDFSIFIETSTRIMVNSHYVHESNKLLDIKKGQTVKISFFYDQFILNTGKYVITTAAYQNKWAIDVIWAATEFEISKINYSKAQHFLPTNGLIRHNPEVNISKE